MSETSIPHAPDPGLPPVKPPSGRFIIQLFLVPGLIVGLIVVVLLFFQWILGSPRSPEQFLKGLDDSNPEVRWRAAADLAQVLPRDKEMAVNVGFALDLSERLRRAIKENNVSEKVRQEQMKEHKGEPLPTPKLLNVEREHIRYLIASLGFFQVPVAVPLLQEIAEDQTGQDTETVFRKRILAVKSLADIGANVKRFDQLSSATRDEILNKLKEESKAEGERGLWAENALHYLQDSKEARAADKHGVASTLVKTASDPTPFLRELSAAALAYWDGDGVEAALLQLTQDDGKGEDPVQRDKEQQEYYKAHPEEIRRHYSNTIRYTAARSLARRGSPLSEKITGLYEEMLDLDKQMEMWKSDNPSEKGAAEAQAVKVVISTLNALDQLRAARPETKINPALLERLVNSDNKAIRSAAQELQNKIR